MIVSAFKNLLSYKSIYRGRINSVGKDLTAEWEVWGSIPEAGPILRVLK